MATAILVLAPAVPMAREEMGHRPFPAAYIPIPPRMNVSPRRGRRSRIRGALQRIDVFGGMASLGGPRWMDKPERQRFKRYPTGDGHIDIAEVRTREGNRHLFVAIAGSVGLRSRGWLRTPIERRPGRSLNTFSKPYPRQCRRTRVPGSRSGLETAAASPSTRID